MLQWEDCDKRSRTHQASDNYDACLKIRDGEPSKRNIAFGRGALIDTVDLDDRPLNRTRKHLFLL